MDELSTHPIPEPIRATDLHQERARALARHPEKRPRAPDRETETNEQDELVENSEPKHDVDISV
jgi:hypothetical protein